ncbi:DUF6538 domain-containing protein [Palleronia sp. THAF1]|uniref:DUF6538 domain-containing protein n=1 Tax=Palleronia sp. THAF1 TaxID=2587842 RepID=UPI001561F930|nr:DUF6538 domain-containing protein [Palleronia sp. THAF1]
MLRRRWYAALDVPKDVRTRIGKARFKESLRTESLSTAEVRVRPVIAKWKQIIEAARYGSDDELERIKSLALEWREDLRRAGPQERETLIDVLPHVAATEATGSSVRLIQDIVLGQNTPLMIALPDWISTSTNTSKTKAMQKADINRLAQRFPMTADVTKKSVNAWVDELQETEGLSPSTIRRILSACRMYWKFLARKDFVSSETDPFSEAAPTKANSSKADKKEKRQPFSPAEVVQLRDKAAQKGDTKLADLITIGMWTGMRIEEICSVRHSDISGALLHKSGEGFIL